MKNILLIILIVFYSNCFAQKIYPSPEKLREKILDFKTVEERLNYLDAQNLINNKYPNYNKVRNPDNLQDTLTFDKTNTSIDIFYKNLFGDSIPEAIFQIRVKGLIYYINFFYKNSKNEWLKVPNFISQKSGSEGGYSPSYWNEEFPNGTYYFEFENLFAENEYILIGKNYYGSYLIQRVDLEFYKITQQEIKQFFHKDILFFQRSLHGDKSQNLKYEFFGEAKLQFPKKLKVTGLIKETNNLENETIQTEVLINEIITFNKE